MLFRSTAAVTVTVTVTLTLYGLYGAYYTLGLVGYSITPRWCTSPQPPPSSPLSSPVYCYLPSYLFPVFSSILTVLAGSPGARFRVLEGGR